MFLHMRKTKAQISCTATAQLISAFVFLMWRSHQPRFHPDLNRGLYRERVGVVLSAPIKSYHVLMSILTIGLIVEIFLPASHQIV